MSLRKFMTLFRWNPASNLPFQRSAALGGPFFAEVFKFGAAGGAQSPIDYAELSCPFLAVEPHSQSLRIEGVKGVSCFRRSVASVIDWIRLSRKYRVPSSSLIRTFIARIISGPTLCIPMPPGLNYSFWAFKLTQLYGVNFSKIERPVELIAIGQ